MGDDVGFALLIEQIYSIYVLDFSDEANAHTFSIVMELIEGHEFLRNQLDYRPRSHWSIDPFGLSATLAKLVSSFQIVFRSTSFR